MHKIKTESDCSEDCRGFGRLGELEIRNKKKSWKRPGTQASVDVDKNTGNLKRLAINRYSRIIFSPENEEMWCL